MDAALALSVVPMTAAQRRRLAIEIIQMRKLLIKGLLAELRGDTNTKRLAERAADRIWEAWPRSLQFIIRVDTRVIDPITRKINREGILAQQEEIR